MHTRAFVASYFDAWNHHDPEAVAAHLARNGRYWDIPEHIEWTHDELIANLDQFFAAFQHCYELIGRVLTDRNTIAFQYRMFPLDDDDNTNTYYGAEFITLRDDAAVMITDYYDVTEIRKTHLQLPPSAHRLPRRKYAKSGLDDQRLFEYKSRLDDVMRSQKLFLRPGLTLPKLAKAVGCSVNHLSQVINSEFNMSFFDYLNKYRVECATELMTGADGQTQAILNIAYTVGFNSISAFYSAFKKHVGQTPAQYRNEQLKQGPSSTNSDLTVSAR